MAISNWQTKRTRQNARNLESLEKIYRPLSSLFLKHHVTMACGEGFPELSQRIKRAWSEFGEYRRWKARFRNSFAALFDRKISRSAEVEFGRSFPLALIHGVVEKNLSIADPKLLELLRKADRSTYHRDQDASILTDEELALFDYVSDRHNQLVKQVRL
jgi:hypothetical protein